MYGCDCDGTKREPVDLGIEGDAIRASNVVIERITGHRPPMCPWRGFSAPIVREVLSVSWAAGGDLSAALGPDPDARLVEGLGVYTRAKRATVAEDERLAAEAAERKRKHAEAVRRSRGH